jgi:hypothetical protein
MATADSNTLESSILERLVVSPDKAAALLSLEFTEHDRDRMRVLAEKARRGELSEVERDEAATYERIDSFLALVQSKARLSLKNSAANGD